MELHLTLHIKGSSSPAIGSLYPKNTYPIKALHLQSVFVSIRSSQYVALAVMITSDTVHRSNLIVT
jgi:hypothetical protein